MIDGLFDFQHGAHAVDDNHFPHNPQAYVP